MTIMMVESEIEELNDLAQFIQETYPDIILVCFSDPQKAIEYERQHKVDALITGIMMDGMNGFVLTKLIRANNPTIYVGLLAPNDTYALNAFKIHANAYLLKPPTKEAIKEFVEYLQQVR